MLEPLWEQVLDSPEDDGPRLVLADALLERGDPRGELIAVQCQLAAVEEDERGPELEALAARERALLAAHRSAWVEGWPLQQLPDFVRGFPERQQARAAELRQHAARAFALAPTLNALELTDVEPRGWRGELHRLSQLPGITRLRRLTLPITFTPADVGPLAAFEPSALRFTGGMLGSVDLLAELPLEELELDFDMGVRDLMALARLPLLAFVCRGNEVPYLPDWPELRRLTLERVGLHVRPLAWPRLERLELLQTRLGRQGLLALLAEGHPTVRRLGLRDERLEPVHLAALEWWPRLEVLDVRGCSVEVRGRAADRQLQRLRRVIR